MFLRLFRFGYGFLKLSGEVGLGLLVESVAAA
jgi:hypothetical protein